VADTTPVGTLRKTSAAAATLTVLISVFAAVASAAQSPTGYRARQNAMCRSNTVKLHALKAEMTRAQQANDTRAIVFDLGELLGIGLREDATIEAAPVPAQLRTELAPAQRLLKAADAIVRRALHDLDAGDGTGAVAELNKLGPLEPPINRYLDAAGLRDCGSNQT
jgi:hypothetical protein